MLPEKTLSGNVSIVSGGGSGIGQAIAEELARLGSTVVLFGRRVDVLKSAAESIWAKGGQAIYFPGDVRDRDRVDEVVAAAVHEFGAVNHLVNSAAGNFQIPPENLSRNGWASVVQIVLDGSWNFTQSVGKHMINNEQGGSILSIGTTSSLIGGPLTVHSTSAKAGVLAMTKSLAGAWAEYGIRLNVLTPGPTAGTGAQDYLYSGEGEWESQVKNIPLGREAALTEVANGAAYLLSDYAGYVTGANLVMDGGRSLGRGGGVFT